MISISSFLLSLTLLASLMANEHNKEVDTALSGALIEPGSIHKSVRFAPSWNGTFDIGCRGTARIL